jgi:hypothetical protein
MPWSRKPRVASSLGRVTTTYSRVGGTAARTGPGMPRMPGKPGKPGMNMFPGSRGSGGTRPAPAGSATPSGEKERRSAIRPRSRGRNAPVGRRPSRGPARSAGGWPPVRRWPSAWSSWPWSRPCRSAADVPARGPVDGLRDGNPRPAPPDTGRPEGPASWAGARRAGYARCALAFEGPRGRRDVAQLG